MYSFEAFRHLLLLALIVGVLLLVYRRFFGKRDKDDHYENNRE